MVTGLPPSFSKPFAISVHVIPLFVVPLRGDTNARADTVKTRRCDIDLLLLPRLASFLHCIR